MYADAWFAGPPLIIWFYHLFVWIFGDNALVFLRIFSCLYLYFTAVFFNGMIVSSKPLKRFPGLPAVLIILLGSTPWYAQELSDSLLVLLPVALTFFIIMQVADSRKRNRSRMFLAGILLMICILTTYKMLFLLLGLSISYLVLAQPKLDEFIALLGGLAVCLGIVLMSLFLNHTLMDFWDIGLLYYMDRLALSHTPLYSHDMYFQMFVLALAWGGTAILALFGFLHFRVKFYSYVVKVRSLETVMAAWLFSVFLVLLFKIQRLELQDFVLIIPPLAFYAGKAFDLKLPRLFRWVPFFLIIAIPFYLNLGFIGLSLFSPGKGLHPSPSEDWRHGGMYEAFTQTQRNTSRKETSVWIMDHQPHLYHRMNWKCANKYTDFRIAYHKIPAFPKTEEEGLISKEEGEKDLFLQNLNAPPEMILDVHGYFPYLQARFPGLFEQYVPKEYENFTIYSLTDIPKEELLDIEEVFQN